MTDTPNPNLPQLQQELHRARLAREVTDNPVYQEAFSSLKADLMRGWESSPARDTEGREHLWLAVNLLGRIERHLQQVMETGRMAELQLQQERSRVDQLKSWLTGRRETLI